MYNNYWGGVNLILCKHSGPCLLFYNLSVWLHLLNIGSSILLAHAGIQTGTRMGWEASTAPFSQQQAKLLCCFNVRTVQSVINNTSEREMDRRSLIILNFIEKQFKVGISQRENSCAQLLLAQAGKKRQAECCSHTKKVEGTTAR